MLGQAEFDFLRSLVRERCAIVLEPGKEYLADTRLAPLLRGGGFPSAVELCAVLRAAPRGELERRVVEAMTTNETSFFRDIHPFEALRGRLLPELLAARAQERRLRLWSGACSSGQEAYSLAMLLSEHFSGLRLWDVSVLATDISRAMVQRTGAGLYGQLEINRGLPAPLLLNHFERIGTQWQIKPALRQLVQARELNLAAPWPTLPRFDVILLRNVLIYFDLDTRRSILRRARQALRPDGYLILGSAETTQLVDERWERVSCGTSVSYRPQAEAGRAAGRPAGAAR